MDHEIQESEDLQLATTERIVNCITDSERIGNETAEELQNQGEQLDNIESKTTKIIQDLKVTQRHITGIKSIFGGIKNWWNSDKDTETSSRPKQGTRKLPKTMEKNNAEWPRPGDRVRTCDGQGFYEQDDPDTPQYFKPVTHSKTEEAINQNLDLVSDCVSRVKELAVALGDEIEFQNDQLDRIVDSVDRADVKLKDQNRQMRGILK